MELKSEIDQAATWIAEGKETVIFTGAGVSVESGVPPFRGPGGLWNKVDPSFIEIENFLARPLECWKLIREIFYDFIGTAKPNAAHLAIAELERLGRVREVITQNIDNLHQEAGSRTVHEFHGSIRDLLCLEGGHRVSRKDIDLKALPPACPVCGGLLKPDFVFFGEAIPRDAYERSIAAAERCDVLVIVGSSGEVMPACSLPRVARRAGAKIVEVNLTPSAFTGTISDLYLEGKAGETLPALVARLSAAL